MWATATCRASEGQAWWSSSPGLAAAVGTRLGPRPRRQHEAEAFLQHRLAVGQNPIGRPIAAERPTGRRPPLADKEQGLRLMAVERLGHVVDEHAAVGGLNQQALHVATLEPDAAHIG